MENPKLDVGSRAVVGRLEHVHVSVADAARSVDYYRRAFGFDVRWESDDPGERCVHVGTDRFYIAMSEERGLPPAAPSTTAAILHLGLVTADLDGLRERLRREGLNLAEIDEVYERKEGRAVYLYDPDGHEIEVVEYGKGYVYG